MNDRQRLVFRVHAVQRMFERAITKEDVRQALETGEAIEAYPEDQPYPSRLVLGWVGTRPIHIVVADNLVQQETIVITAYELDPAKWQAGFQRRR